MSAMSETNQISNSDVELLLAGRPVEPELQGLARYLAAVRSTEAVDAGLLERITVEAAATATDATGAGAATTAGRWGLWWRRRAVAAATAATLLFGSGAGAAVAADGAAPGDLLYGLDRALERVGISNGGAEERLAEVEQLVTEGQLARGIEHARETVTQNGNRPDDAGTQASEALRAAAERVRATASADHQPAGQDVTSAVADLLTYLSDNVGHVDGGTVAGLAQAIGDSVHAERRGPPEGVPASPGPDPAIPSHVDPPGNPNPGSPPESGGRP